MGVIVGSKYTHIFHCFLFSQVFHIRKTYFVSVCIEKKKSQQTKILQYLANKNVYVNKFVRFLVWLSTITL